MTAQVLYFDVFFSEKDTHLNAVEHFSTFLKGLQFSEILEEL